MHLSRASVESLFRTSLQRRLILAFLIVLLIPTTILSVYNLLRTQQFWLGLVYSAYARRAETRAAKAEALCLAAAADLLAAAHLPALTSWMRDEPVLPTQIGADLQRFLEQTNRRYRNLCLFDLQGRAVACAQHSGAAPTASDEPPYEATPAIQAALRRAGRTGLERVALAPVTRLSPETVLHYAMLLERDGAARGALVLTAPAAALLEALVSSEPGVSTAIVDANGTYLFDSAGQASGTSTPLSFRSDDAWAERSEAVIVDSAGTPQTMYVLAPVQPHHTLAEWSVFYTISLQGVAGEIWRTQAVIVVIALAALAAALLLAMRLTNDLMRPVRALVAAASQIGGGDLHTPVPVHGADEIGTLGQVLEQTVTRLREAITVAEGRRQEAETLFAAAQAISSTLNLHQVLSLILNELRKVVPYDSASVQVVHDGYSEIVGAYGLRRGSEVIGLRFSLASGATPNAEVAATRAPVILDDAPAKYPYLNEEPYCADPIRSWLGVPLFFGERLIGMLTLDKRQVGFFTAEHARLAAAFAAQAAIALENARLYEETRRELAERKQAEAAYARLADIIEATTDFVGIFRLDGSFLYLNQAGRRLIGLAATADLGDLRVTDLVAPDAVAPLHEAMQTAIRSGTWTGEVTLLHRSGSPIPASQVLIAHYGPDGQAEYLATIARDMREQRRAEEERRQVQKMEALGRLAGGVAHDFNNILTVILNEASLLLEDLAPDDPRRSSVEQIRQAGAHAAALTRQLLTFSRRQAFQPELLDLNQIIVGIEQMLRRLIGEHIRLTIMLADDLPPILADQSQLEQVVLNLVVNARDAMPEGGHLLIKTALFVPNQVCVCQYPISEIDQYVLLIVADTGVGIDPEVQPHIFEPFFTTKPRGKGTGLGLAMVHGIVQQVGGHIRFHSELGRGTTFEIYLPAASSTAAISESTSNSAAPLLQSHGAILLVEGDAEARRSLCRILTYAGFTVLEAADGPTALMLANQYVFPIQGLLTDLNLPGEITGIELAASIRARRPSTAVVYMVDGAGDRQIDLTLLSGKARFITKPFTPQSLLCTLDEALAVHRAACPDTGCDGNGYNQASRWPLDPSGKHT